MKQHAKVGNRAGKPAFRTPSSFRNKQVIETASRRASEQNYNRLVKKK